MMSDINIFYKFTWTFIIAKSIDQYQEKNEWGICNPTLRTGNVQTRRLSNPDFKW